MFSLVRKDCKIYLPYATVSLIHTVQPQSKYLCMTINTPPPNFLSWIWGRGLYILTQVLHVLSNSAQLYISCKWSYIRPKPCRHLTTWPFSSNSVYKVALLYEQGRLFCRYFNLKRKECFFFTRTSLNSFL